MDKKLNLALIGFGKFGKIYLKNIKKNKSFKLVSIFRKKKVDNPKFKTLSKKNLKLFKIDAAIVCTPVKTHFKISKLLIENKIPIILEKPAANSIKEINILNKISIKNKTSVIVNHSDLFNEEFKFLLSKKKLINKINFISASFGKFSLNYKDKNQLPYKDWLPHTFALIFKFIKKINFLDIISNKIIKKKNSIFQELIICFKSRNIEGIINFSNFPRMKSRSLTIFGSRGTIEYDGYNRKNNYFLKNKKIIPKKTQRSPMQAILDTLYYITKNKIYHNDLDISLKIEKVLQKIENKL